VNKTAASNSQGAFCFMLKLFIYVQRSSQMYENNQKLHNL